MSKQNLILPCKCGYNCGAEMTIGEDDENLKLSTLSVKDKAKFIPDFFTLDREGALDLVKWLIAKYKLRDELSSLDSGNNKKALVKNIVKEVELPIEPLEMSEDTPEEEIVEEFRLVSPPIEIKKKRGRPRKNT